jgi:Fe2+ transport system protein B
MRAKVGNYAGVTVERKEGRLQGTPPGCLQCTVLDLPGSYSLSPQSPDEAGRPRRPPRSGCPKCPRPTPVLVVVDASNLERNLYYATQVIELGYPTVVASSTWSTSLPGELGFHVDQPPRLAAPNSACRSFPLVASTRRGAGCPSCGTEPSAA